MSNKLFISKLGCCVVLAGALLMPTAKASAQTTQTLIDWDLLASGWTPPLSGETRSFSSGEGTVDLRFDLGATTRFSSFGGSGLTPAISSTLNGSQGDDNRSLHLQIDADAVGLTQGANSATLTANFNDFNNPLEDVSFLLYDVDISDVRAWQDRVILRGFFGGQVVNPIFNPVLPLNNTIQIVDANTIDGVRFNADATNADNGNVLVSFASAIDSFELIFTDGDDIGTRNPTNHGIGIGDISYTVPPQTVPEPGALLGFWLLGTFGASSVWKRKQNNVC
jgi:hypothetical protein